MVEMLAPIASGKVKTVQPLPSKRELSDRFGLSKTVVRETIHDLEAKGVLEVLSERGVHVAAVPASHVLEALDLNNRGEQSQNLISAADIGEVQKMLEPKLVKLACEHATASDLKEFEKSHRPLSHADSSLLVGQCDTEFPLEDCPQPVQRNLADRPEARHESSLEGHGPQPRGLPASLRGGMPE